MIIDTHCHYNLEPLTTAWEINWRAAREHGVVGSIVVGTNLDSSKRAVDQTSSQEALRCSVGIHPTEASDLQATGVTVQAAEKQLHDLAREHAESVIAIGECGLDYFRMHKSADVSSEKSAQLALARMQLQLAGELQLPLIIHLRDKGEDAYRDFLALFKEVDPGVTPILHCVSGPVDWLSSMLDLGAYVGAAGNVTYRSADHVRTLITHSDPDRVLLETDAPFLPPQAHRGKVCEPWMIEDTAVFLEAELGLSKDRIISNTLSVFPQFSSIVGASA